MLDQNEDETQFFFCTSMIKGEKSPVVIFYPVLITIESSITINWSILGGFANMCALFKFLFNAL